MTSPLGFLEMNMNSFPSSFMTGNFRGMGIGGYNGNIFTNGFGEPNYNKLTGFQIGTTLFQYGFAALNSYKASKNEEESVDYNKLIHDNTNNISELSNQKLDLTTSNEILNRDITDLKTSQPDLETSIKKIEDQLNKLTNSNNEETNKKEISNLKEQLAKKQQELDNNKKAIKDKTCELNENNIKIADLEKQITKLKDENKIYQEKLDKATLKDDSGSFINRASRNQVEEFDASDNASSSEMRGAIRYFIKAKTPEEKRKYAEIAKKMYNSNLQLEDKFEDSYKLIEKWLKDNPKTNKDE